ncbi:VirK/YbjX family protein [Escherichia coli]|uniref:VirK/YbjX family protein n=1 Tax=Escherichia coli TaxID=562 RepID=UPI00136841FD|nr:VirK/YbjX family protein [Escherichia coli]ELQ3424297.1 DUF535 domain-containing protein [Salmonella enterica]MXE60948.1 DUF535 domain-containing protein [Escherichia coli]
MKSLSFLSFLKEVILSRGFLHGKWKSRKFRFMYVFRCVMNPVSSVRYYNSLLSLNYIEDILTVQPVLPAKIHRPYLHKGGCARTREKYIIGHYRFIQELPEEYLAFFLPLTPVSLARFVGKNGEGFNICCSSSSFDREGELTLSLIFDKIPVARLTFSIIPTENGYSAFIGGLQGAPKNIGPDVIRWATRACYGIFPKRILFEAFCSLMKFCNITELLAVSEYSHVFRQLRYRYHKRKSFVAIYSSFWRSVAGEVYGEWFRLPNQIARKSLSDIASKKRSEYRKRYRLLDDIHHEVACSLQSKMLI